MSSTYLIYNRIMNKQTESFKYDKFSVGDRVKAKRTELGLTQGELAKKSGLTQQNISFVETGINDPSGRFLALVAVALNVSADWLLGLSDEKENHWWHFVGVFC